MSIKNTYLETILRKNQDPMVKFEQALQNLVLKQLLVQFEEADLV